MRSDVAGVAPSRSAGDLFTVEVTAISPLACKRCTTLMGEVHMLATHEKIVSGADGTFSGRIPAGRVDVVFSVPGFATQKTALTVEDGDNVVVDVDMRRLGSASNLKLRRKH